MAFFIICIHPPRCRCTRVRKLNLLRIKIHNHPTHGWRWQKPVNALFPFEWAANFLSLEREIRSVDFKNKAMDFLQSPDPCTDEGRSFKFPDVVYSLKNTQDIEHEYESHILSYGTILPSPFLMDSIHSLRLDASRLMRLHFWHCWSTISRL